MKSFWSLCTVVICVAVVVCAGVAAAGTVRLAHGWKTDSSIHIGIEAAAKAFEAKHPDIKIEINTSMSATKVKVELAAGTPADLFVVWPAISWGADGFIRPLDKYIKQSKLTKDGFIPAAWDRDVWNNQVWALPLWIDPNFANVWHKDKFAEAGLPPEKGPATIKELDMYIKRLTIGTDDKPVQLGMVPWQGCGTCGNGNNVLMWGWIFGGEFYNQATGQVTAHDNRNVQALEYLKDYWSRYNNMYVGLGGGLPTGRNRFTAGKEVMRFTVSGEAFQAMRDFGLDLGFGKMPTNIDNGTGNAAFLGGFSLGMLTGGKNPDEAWQFLQYITSDPEGVSLFAEGSGYMPGFTKAPAFRKLGQDSKWKVYIDVALTATRYYPPTPVFQFLYNQLNALLPKALNGSVETRAGLEEVTRLAELEYKNKYGKL